jgi:hypothetical protein
MKSKRYFYQVPAHVSTAEAAALYEFMATLEPNKTKFLDKCNQCIFDVLNDLTIGIDGYRYFIGTQELIHHLSDNDFLEKAGGLAYVQKVFNSLEPMGAVC